MTTLILSLLTGFCFLLFNLSQEKSPITVIVSNIKNDKGHAVMSIFKDEEGFPMEVPITNGVATFTVTDLPTGNYAFAIIHDENRNGWN